MTTPARAAYLNPVYDSDFPDPFVLKFRGEYWAYCTGFWRDGRCFGVMHSRDLVHWRELAGALTPLPGDNPCYWAPEVVYRNGRFLMYYSVGNEKLMHIRVAIAEHPAGPFEDSGRQLTHEEFAIDAHVFIAADGTRWLFYATDFLTHTHIGTGTVRDRMLDDFTLACVPRPVTRARYDWQVYDPHRVEKGGVRWHTVEGPFVLAHKGKLYQMFSGGNWQNVTYGVSYAISDAIEREDEWAQVADGQRVLPILRTIPGEVIGPGHNSVVRGPDNQQLFCVYHRWREGVGRVLAIDRLDWVGERMTVLGPSTTPQPAPLQPSFIDYFDEEHATDLGNGWTVRGGQWSVCEGEARQAATEGEAAAVCNTHAQSFVAELSLRALSADAKDGYAFGVSLENETQTCSRFMLRPNAGQAVLSCADEQGVWRLDSFSLPADFAPSVAHLLRVEVDGTCFRIQLDDHVVQVEGQLATAPDRIALVTEDKAAAFAGFALTVGWEAQFMRADWRARGWRSLAKYNRWWVEDSELKCVECLIQPEVLVTGAPLVAYELVVNMRLGHERPTGSRIGFYPALAADDERGPLLTVERRAEGGWIMLVSALDQPQHEFPLPETFDPSIQQQFRVRKEAGKLSVQWDAARLGMIDAPHTPTRIGLFAHESIAAFDLVRVTEIKQ
ncbi:MAG: glycoside hydrolase family 43 protein [Pyrinomonadaceae bacterium]